MSRRSIVCATDTMPLTLRAISLDDHPLTQPMVARFGADGGSIGRADHNTLALPDPERHISRHHAEIHADGDSYVIRNVSSANPIVVRGQPLGRGETALLVHRDQVRIGGYLLEVLEDEEGEVAGAVAVPMRPELAPSEAPVVLAAKSRPRLHAAPVQPRGVSARSSRGGTLPGATGLAFGDLKAPLSVANPFAELLGDSAPVSELGIASTGRPAPSGRAANGLPEASRPASARLPEPAPTALQPQPPPRHGADPFADLFPPAAGVSASSGAWAPPAVAPARALLPDDFDPFAAPPSRPPASTRPANAAIGSFDDLVPCADPASIDDFLGLRPGDRDPLADFMAGVPPRRADGVDGGDPPLGTGGLSTDPMALFAGPPTGSVPSGGLPQGAGDVPEWRAAFAPPKMQAQSPAAETAADASRLAAPQITAVRAPPAHEIPAPAVADLPSTPTADHQLLWAAFCAGAGIAPDLPPGTNPRHQLQLAGSLLKSAVAGTLQLMMVRSTTKQELGADVTMIRARNNNPLKFSPDATSALEQLLKPPVRGFLPGPAAMTDAMDDLVGHAIGTMAGTRAALEGVLDRFGPQELEAQLAARSVFDSVLPMNRKAKLWELYLRHFDTIRNEAQEDFHALFGRAFLGAYRQQLARLRQEDAHRHDEQATDHDRDRPRPSPGAIRD